MHRRVATRSLLTILCCVLVACDVAPAREAGGIRTPAGNPKSDGVDASCLQQLSGFEGSERALRYLAPGGCPGAPASDLPDSDGLDPSRALPEVARAIDQAAMVYFPADSQRRDLLRHLLIGAMAKESSFNTREQWEPRDDATYGLLQIRWSSTVHDFLLHADPVHRDAANTACAGLFDELAARAVDWQRPSSFHAGGKSGPELMMLPACNVLLGAWYYLASATIRGNDLDTHCRGGDRDALVSAGAPTTWEIGLASHRAGPTLVKSYLLQRSEGGWYDPGGRRMSGHNGWCPVNEEWDAHGCSWSARFAPGCNGNEDLYADKIGHFAFLAARVEGSALFGAAATYSAAARQPGRLYSRPLLLPVRDFEVAIPLRCSGPAAPEELPVCQQGSASDPDGDGWGWEHNASCRVTQDYPICKNGSASDPDGDGWGWENSASCRAP